MLRGVVPRGRRLLSLIFILPIYTALIILAQITIYYVVLEPLWGWFHVAQQITQFTPVEWLRDFSDPYIAIFIVVPALLLVASQIAFLVPWFISTPFSRGGRRSLMLSMTAAALVAAMLTVSLYFVLLASVKLVAGEVEFGTDFDVVAWLLAGAIAVSWLFWTGVFWLFTSRMEPHRRLKRWAGLLLGGTIAELVLVLPLDIMVRRKTDCYCATPAYWSVCMSLWALLWLTGPGIVLLLTRKRRHRLWSGRHCLRCGYEKGPTPSDRCAECGFEW